MQHSEITALPAWASQRLLITTQRAVTRPETALPYVMPGIVTCLCMHECEGCMHAGAHGGLGGGEGGGGLGGGLGGLCSTLRSQHCQLGPHRGC